MKRFQPVTPALFLTVLIVTLTACSQIKAIPGLPASHPEALTVGQQANCTECHEDEQKGTMKAISIFNHSPSFVRNHKFYAASDDRLCATCHKSSFCNDCHTNQVEMKPSVKYGYRPDREMPHRGNYMTMHKIDGKLDPASCLRCHGRANNERCVACHR
jgi:nitrate reductase cytochrome c-type subunit